MNQTTGTKSRRGHHVLLAAGAAAGLMGVGGEARAQWTVIRLHPEGASQSTAAAIHGATQVGTINGNLDAVLWRNAAETVVRLTPTPEGGTARGYAAFGDFQGGGVSPTSMSEYASLWSGTAQSWVNLHPTHIPGAIASCVKAIDGDIQGGQWTPQSDGFVHFGRACIWNGTAESWVDLNPEGYETTNILGMSGGQQVGATYDAGLAQAVMWSGTPESFVFLNGDAFFSTATCTDGTHQYGTAVVADPDLGVAFLPVRWSGTAESRESMLTDGNWGSITACHGGWMAGSTSLPGDSVERAAVWTGGPDSNVDLHQFLPDTYTWSRANGIWRHEPSGTTYIVGDALFADGVVERYEAMMWVSGPGVNLITTADAPADCSAVAGDPLVYTARVVNAGADAAAAVLTVDLPPASEAVFASAVPTPSSATPTQLVFDLGSLDANGGLVEVSITMTAVGPGTTPTLSFSAAAPGEVHADNNAASASTRITPTPPATAAATAILSTDPTLANSLLPGGDGARFTAFNAPMASPSGNWWALRASVDLPDALRFVLLRTPTGGDPATIVQTGVTTNGNGTVTVFSQPKVNDAGVVAFAGGDDGPEGTRGFVATTSGGPLADAVRDGQPVPALPGETFYGGPRYPINILADGSTAFYAVTFPSLAGAFLTGNGAAVVARAGEWPAWSEYPIESLLTTFGTPGAFGVDAAGSQHIFQAMLATGNQADDGIVVANGAIILQEGVTVLPGSEAPVNVAMAATMGPAGHWMIRGFNTDGAAWTAMGQGQTISRMFNEGDAIYPGAAERWQRHPIAGSFFLQAVDASGNFVVGGHTDVGDEFADAVLVYNGQAVLARENDPVDLDGNGVFDDGVYIRSIDHDSVTFIPGAVLLTISYRDEDAAICHANNTSRGQAIVRIPLPGGGCPADWDQDGQVNSNDISAFLTAWLDSVQSGNLIADFDGSGQVNSNDISAFLTAWLSAVGGGC